MWFNLLLMLSVGLFFFWLGGNVLFKQRIDLIISYHHKRVSEQNIKVYTRLVGISLLIIGSGCVLSGILSLFIGAKYSILATLCSLPLAFFVMNIAQSKYNKGWF